MPITWWNDIPNLKGYEASTTGKIRYSESLKEILPRVENGYKMFTAVLDDDKRINVAVHIAVAKTWVKYRPPLWDYVTFVDGDPLNLDPNNLSWTPKHFQLDYYRRKGFTHLLPDHSDESIQIGQYDKKTGELLNIFPSISQAAQSIPKASKGAISKCLSGNRKSHKGYIWKKIDDNT